MNKEENNNQANNKKEQSSEEVKEQQSDGEEEVEEEQQSDAKEEVKEQQSDVEEEVKEQQSDGKEEVKEVEEQQSDGEEVKEVEEQQSDGEEEVKEQQSDVEEEVEEKQTDVEEEEQHNGEEEVEEKINSKNNEEENINEKKKKNNKKESKSKKEIKPKFSSNCLKCNKLFKNESLYNKHKLEQVCYKNNELTYCKLCNITLTTHNEYKTHLFTLDHINQIGCNTLEKINKPNDKTIHSLDPYLNKNEVKNISSKNLGSSFTFVYETGSTQTVSLINNETNNETYNVNTTINTNENNDTYNSINNSTDNSINTIIIPEPTLRQSKIINFLEKQIADNKPIQDSGNLFYKMLDNKLQIDDYKNLQKIITHLNINNDYKKTYLDTINLFISFLVKEKTNRKTIYKDKDISQLVINLTS